MPPVNRPETGCRFFRVAAEFTTPVVDEVTSPASSERSAACSTAGGLPTRGRLRLFCALTGLTLIGLLTASGSALTDSAARAEEGNAAATTTDSETPAPEEPQRELFRGKVVLAQAALKRRGIKVAEEMKNQAVLETPDGELIPIAADWRGRAFYQDERLRDRDVELVGYRREGLPYLQVLIVYMQDEKAGRREMDYWCEICAIPMYEIKECECCQGPIELRLRPAKLPDFLTAPPEPGDSGR